MQKTILIIAILVLLGLGTWFVFAPSETQAPDGNGQDNPPTDGVNGGQNGGQTGDTADWETFQSGETGTGWRFSIDHPAAVSANEVSDSIYEFKYIGPESEQNTEITDGYYISLQLLPDETFESYNEIDEAIGVVEETTFNGYAARRYQSETALGNTTNHITFMLENGTATLVDISYSTYADDGGAYQEQVDAILATLAFESRSTAGLGDRIRVSIPTDNTVVESPLTIEGEARGTWYFEASFPVVLVNWDGLIIAEGSAQAEGEWMTEDFVPFRAELTFDDPYAPGDPDFMQNGTLILQRANPSGLPENDAALEIPVRFAP